jgi:apolipoprotein N-acyltransferase
LLCWWRVGPGRRRLANAVVGTGVAVVVLLGNAWYGAYRLEQADFKDGPRVAVIQEDFPQWSKEPYSEHQYVVFAQYLALAAEAARERPDLLVFPETVWGSTQNIEFVEQELQAPEEVSALTWQYGKLCHGATSAFARGDYAEVNQVIARFERALNAVIPTDRPKYELPRLPAEGGPPVTLVVGCVSLDTLPEQAYPRQKRYNSAVVYDRDGVQRRERYDKIHLVPFGEVVPFRNARPLGFDLHWLYRFLNRLSPFSYGGAIEYSLSPGERYTVFDLASSAGATRFGVPICYEDTVPDVPRRYVWAGGRRRVDFLVNISNDGWFLHSAELPQHLAICVFRAVENRVAIARAVNTGISGFIEPSGRIDSLVEEGGRRYGAGLVGYRVAPVKLDDRGSCYGRLGDWFATLCVLGAAALWVGAIVTRWIFNLRKWLAARRARKRGG